MSIFKKEPISVTKKALTMTEAEALAELEKQAKWIVDNARWTGLSRSRVNQLRRPLIALRQARRAKR